MLHLWILYKNSMDIKCFGFFPRLTMISESHMQKTFAACKISKAATESKPECQKCVVCKALISSIQSMTICNDMTGPLCEYI